MVVNDFELPFHDYVYLWTNTLWKSMKPPLSPAIG